MTTQSQAEEALNVLAFANEDLYFAATTDDPSERAAALERIRLRLQALDALLTAAFLEAQDG